ncbi:MAG: hypothetical protein HUM72_12675 [Dolichospermum sp.]|nr:hypothetical protein [Dolichospermum sp.]
MSTLLIETLESELSQVIKLSGSERCSIGAIIPYIYMHNAPAGTFTLSVLSGSSTLFSGSFTSENIKSSIPTLNNYAHVFYPIVPVNPVQFDSGTYTIKLTSTGYLPTSVSFLALIRQHEDLNNTMDYAPITDDKNPLAIRIKLYKRGEL